MTPQLRSVSYSMLVDSAKNAYFPPSTLQLLAFLDIISTRIDFSQQLWLLFMYDRLIDNNYELISEMVILSP